MYILETEDLILKSGSVDDWKDLYHNLWSRPEVFRYLFSRPSDSEETAEKKTAAYAQMHREVLTEFFVYEKTTNRAIGIAGLKEMQPGIFTVTDIAIGPHFSGRGYGKQILKALTKLAFEQCGASGLHYDCFVENTASRRLAESCGFVYTHSQPAELQKNGVMVMLAYYRYQERER